MNLFSAQNVSNGPWNGWDRTKNKKNQVKKPFDYGEIVSKWDMLTYRIYSRPTISTKNYYFLEHWSGMS